MKWYYYLASHLVVALGFFILGYYAGGCGEVKYKWKTETKVVYKVQWYEKLCGKLIIDGKREGDSFRVKVDDLCVHADRLLEATCVKQEHLILPEVNIMAGFNSGKFDALAGLGLNYVRFYHDIGIGGSVKYQRSLINKANYFGGSILAGLKF